MFKKTFDDEIPNGVHEKLMNELKAHSLLNQILDTTWFEHFDYKFPSFQVVPQVDLIESSEFVKYRDLPNRPQLHISA